MKIMFSSEFIFKIGTAKNQLCIALELTQNSNKLTQNSNTKGQTISEENFGIIV